MQLRYCGASALRYHFRLCTLRLLDRLLLLFYFPTSMVVSFWLNRVENQLIMRGKVIDKRRNISRDKLAFVNIKEIEWFIYSLMIFFFPSRLLLLYFSLPLLYSHQIIYFVRSEDLNNNKDCFFSYEIFQSIILTFRFSLGRGRRMRS